MLFNYIVNPESGRRVSIYGKTGKRVLGNYLYYLRGGMQPQRGISAEDVIDLKKSRDIMRKALKEAEQNLRKAEHDSIEAAARAREARRKEAAARMAPPPSR